MAHGHVKNGNNSNDRIHQGSGWCQRKNAITLTVFPYLWSHRRWSAAYATGKTLPYPETPIYNRNLHLHPAVCESVSQLKVQAGYWQLLHARMIGAIEQVVIKATYEWTKFSYTLDVSRWWRKFSNDNHGKTSRPFNIEIAEPYDDTVDQGRSFSQLTAAVIASWRWEYSIHSAVLTVPKYRSIVRFTISAEPENLASTSIRKGYHWSSPTDCEMSYLAIPIGAARTTNGYQLFSLSTFKNFQRHDLFKNLNPLRSRIHVFLPENKRFFLWGIHNMYETVPFASATLLE